MGTFSPRARLWSCSLSDQAWVPDTVAKWRTRSFARVNSFEVGSYGVGRVRQPGKIGGELANSAWHQKPAWILRREVAGPEPVKWRGQTTSCLSRYRDRPFFD